MANAPRKKSPKNKEKKRATQPAPEASLNFPIVAIGASAGGLEAFSNLLRALPPQPGVALIFIPHLDPTHEGAMVELLSRTTRLPVLQAAEGMRVQVNSVYVLPPNSDMTIGAGVFASGPPRGWARPSHAHRCLFPLPCRRSGFQFNRSHLVRHRQRRHAGPGRDQRQRRDHFRAGYKFCQVRWHAEQRDSLLGCRLRTSAGWRRSLSAFRCSRLFPSLAIPSTAKTG